MHKKIKGLEFIYEEHKYHHGAYSPGRFVNSSSKHRYLGLVLCIEHIFITLIPLIAVLALSRPIYVPIVIGFGILHQVMYNKLHVGMHLGRKINFLPRWFLDLCVSNHYWHHEEPKTHFCVAAPGADWIVGTVSKAFSWVQHADDYEVNPKDDLEIEKLNICKATLYKYTLPGVDFPWESTKLSRLLTKAINWIFIGKVEIVYTSGIPIGSLIYASNHGSWRDVFLYSSLDRKARLMCHIGVMRSCFGIVGLILSRVFGFFTVAPGDSAGLDLGRRILATPWPSSVAICPEGWAWLDGKVRGFKTGVVRLSRGESKLKALVHPSTYQDTAWMIKEYPIVPVYIKYNYYPGEWILKFPPPVQYLISALLPKSRSGATIYVGRPFHPQSEDLKEATEEVRQEIIKLGQHK